MAFKASLLALSLALALSSSAFAAELPNAIEISAGVHHFEIDRIAKGKFVRIADGTDAATVVVTGQHGLVINGGHFSTAKPVNYTRGIELARGKSISLYNKEKPTQQPGSPEANYNLYTADEIKSIFASGDKERINKAFTSSDANKIAPEHLTEANALAALQAASEVAAAREKTAWKLISRTGNLEVNGGSFNFHSVNQNIISADAGQLIWNGGNLVSSGGGGDTILQGAAGINILGGSIKSNGSVDGKPTAVQYDDRHRLNRDRWTLGKYLAFITNGDVNVGRLGKPGPVIDLTDGMLKIDAAPGTQTAATSPRTHNFNLNSGTVTVRGDSRSTLLALERTFDIVSTIKGGTLTIATGKKLARTPTESPSMWNIKTILDGGTINLDNAELIGPNSAIRSGTVNMAGRSSISSPMGSLTITGGTINVGAQSFIGAIRGDSKAYSPYPTSQQDLVINGGTLHFKLVAPAQGQQLKVGTDIGGIYAGDNNPNRSSHPTLSIAPDTVMKLDTSALKKGTYTAVNFASVEESDGKLEIAAPIQLGGPKLPYTGTLDTNGQLSFTVR
ncbi:MAG: hypothetical protein ABIQ36_04885 [Rhodanobacter sp.]